ncbi:hypothetical protein K504DRAFT_463649 [Pleomassaria siparia CBS 279.74]|uniref:SAP domain-containing protein n=1 Tax=Pleomassaria siparia CBS 279.74 TaxID=1314801 RepID=A0A6G1JRM1_9PLEO|nr:hypothetical protein K504DRAFT_463649 [Pleomassaria siparia CBS 279.74]
MAPTRQHSSTNAAAAASQPRHSQEELEKLSTSTLRRLLFQHGIATSGLTRKAQFIAALLAGGNTKEIKDMKKQPKPEPKRIRVTKSLRQQANPRPQEFVNGGVFSQGFYEGHCDRFFVEDHGRMTIARSPQHFISTGTEDLAPKVTVVGTDLEIIVSDFPMHIWLQYALPGFKETIELFAVKKDGYLPGGHLVVSNMVSGCYRYARSLFLLMASATRDGKPFQIPSIGWSEDFDLHNAAKHLGLELHILAEPDLEALLSEQPSLQDFALETVLSEQPSLEGPALEAFSWEQPSLEQSV